MSASPILVPITESSTLRQTVEYAVSIAVETEDPSVRFVAIRPAEYVSEADEPDESWEALLNRVAVWADEDASNRDAAVDVTTAILGTDEYLFSPEDVAGVLARDASRHDVERVIFDPEYNPGIGAPLLRPLEVELSRYAFLDVEEAPIRRPVRRRPLIARTSMLQIGALFGIAFIFYQILAGGISMFDVVTGAISALIVGIGLSKVTFGTDPKRQTLGRLVRMAIYIPYLLFEIIKANIIVAGVILHPRLPIEPRMTRITPAVWGGLPVTTLANSITLTPGTLSVRVDGRTLTVHTLVPSAREDLFGGRLERAVRFVFYGRPAMAIASLEERGETTILPATGQTVEGADSMPTDESADSAELGGEKDGYEDATLADYSTEDETDIDRSTDDESNGDSADAGGTDGQAGDDGGESA